MKDPQPSSKGVDNKAALELAIARLYGELREIAGRIFGKERAGHTLQPTAVANEAYLRLRDQRNLDPNDRTQLLAAAATAMRRVLIDHARAKITDKHTPPGRRVPLDGQDLGREEPVDILELNDALERLGSLNPQAEKIVELRYFGGLSVNEVGTVLKISARSVANQWSFAKVWLHKKLGA